MGLKQVPFAAVIGVALFMIGLVIGCAPAASGQMAGSGPPTLTQVVSNNTPASSPSEPLPTDTVQAEPRPTFTPTPRLTPTRLPPGPTIPPTPSPIPASPTQVKGEAGQTATPTFTSLPPPPTVTATVAATLSLLPSPTVQPEADLLALINQERTTRGLTALTTEPRLMAAAQAHSQDMADNNFFDHVGSDGSEPGDRITRQNYRWRFFAENLACNYPTAEATLQGWLDSPGHRANLLAPEAEQIGLGWVYAPDTDCIFYWTALFAAGD